MTSGRQQGVIESIPDLIVWLFDAITRSDVLCDLQEERRLLIGE